MPPSNARNFDLGIPRLYTIANTHTLRNNTSNAWNIGLNVSDVDSNYILSFTVNNNCIAINMQMKFLKLPFIGFTDIMYPTGAQV